MCLRQLADYAGSEMDGMSYITGRNGNPNVFNLKRNENGLWLNDNWANPDNKWNSENEVVFSLRKYCLFRAYLARFFMCGLSKLFLQPHSILPISSNLTAISSYCLFEINLPSQAVDIRNLRMSDAKIHSEIFSAFFVRYFSLLTVCEKLCNTGKVVQSGIKWDILYRVSLRQGYVVRRIRSKN